MAQSPPSPEALRIVVARLAPRGQGLAIDHFSVGQAAFAFEHLAERTQRRDRIGIIITQELSLNRNGRLQYRMRLGQVPLQSHYLPQVRDRFDDIRMSFRK